QVGRKTGHRERFGRDFGTGGAENGTPGAIRQGFRGRWGGKRDTGRGSAGISGQVGRKMGHRARFGRDFGTGGAENGTPGEVWRGFSGEIYSEKGGAVGETKMDRPWGLSGTNI
ncbi:MAG: hypothetical protein IKH00_07270, partial [Bacteroidales bacterium]|nr:hypothetical protein [Bacteroidales bacterium]